MKMPKMLKVNGKLEASLLFFTTGVLAFVLGLLISSMLHMEKNTEDSTQNTKVKWANTSSNMSTQER